MAGYLTTHVLDTARGRPADGLKIVLTRLDGDTRTQLARVTTNGDGRTDAPVLPEAEFATGTYELEFHCADYLRRAHGPDASAFLGVVPIRFEMLEAAHYHVPLLLSPFGYSTYRGS